MKKAGATPPFSCPANRVGCLAHPAGFDRWTAADTRIPSMCRPRDRGPFSRTHHRGVDEASRSPAGLVATPAFAAEGSGTFLRAEAGNSILSIDDAPVIRTQAARRRPASFQSPSRSTTARPSWRSCRRDHSSSDSAAPHRHRNMSHCVSHWSPWVARKASASAP